MNKSVAFNLTPPKTHSSVVPKHVPPPKDTAQYIADMVLELHNLAKGAGLRPLQSLLESTFHEAFSVANRVAVPEHEQERLRELIKASQSYTS